MTISNDTAGQSATSTAESTKSITPITLILNPASGVNRTALDAIQAYLDDLSDVQYTLHLTENQGDATRFAREGAAQGTQMVIGYGGDGTMAEIADGLRGTGVSFGILPGGTANVMTVELGIPQDLTAALDLIFKHPHQVREVDMGIIDQQPFLLRAGIGYEAEVSATAERAAKKARGRLAYFENALNHLRKLRPVRYVITVDGQTHVTRGITCMICNSSNIGFPNLRLTHETDVSDGVLDVIVINSIRPGSILRLIWSILRSFLPAQSRLNTQTVIDHWQGKNITVEMSRRQVIAYDGEYLKRAKRVSATIIPDALRIIVPPQPNDGKAQTT